VNEGWENLDNRTVFEASDWLLKEGYGEWCRVREVIEYSKKMGYRKLGIAFCVAVRTEAKVLHGMLEANGFDVYSVSCMAGSPTRKEVGFENMIGLPSTVCNPLMQAQILNSKETDLNIVAGLCVGHDVLFVRHSIAGVTTLIVKDRVLAHNPIAALTGKSSHGGTRLTHEIGTRIRSVFRSLVKP
jgi:uncharacterized metal-binding protein